MKNPSPATNGIVAHNLIRLLLGILILLVVESATFGQSEGLLSEEAKIPKLLKRATDFTNTLSAAEIASVEQDLARFEDSTSTQLVVVLIPTIGSESLEDFSFRTAEANRIGQKGKDSGILLLIVKDDRKIRIEVGYGLEGVLPDGLSGQIIRREITPYFRTGDYYAGIKAGIEAIMLATRNEYKTEKKSTTSGSLPFLWILFLLFVMFLILRGARRSSSLRRAAGLPIFFGSGLGGGSLSSHGHWGSSGGGGGGFGGFSGGGGSFGGGGASGSW